MKSDFINIYAGISDKSQKEFKQYLYCFYGNQKQILTLKVNSGRLPMIYEPAESYEVC